MHPIDGEEDAVPMLRDAIAAPFVDAIGAAAGLSAAATRSLDRKLQRNQMGLKLRVAGELIDFGSSVFPFSAMFNHSCRPHALWRPLSSGSAIIVRALRAIRVGEEVSVSYLPTSMVGQNRITSLKETHGFVCQCERCAATPGSALYERERWDFGLVCSGGAIGDGHTLLPDDPYDAARCTYRCAHSGCTVTLAAADALAKVQRVVLSFKALHAHLSQENAPPAALAAGCWSAVAAERAAVAVLAPRHHEWMAWTAAAMVLAEQADDEELLVAAYRKREAALVAERAEDADIFIRLNHALVAGLETSQAAELLREAFDLDYIASGVGVDGWIARWVPDDLDIVDDVRRILEPKVVD